MLSVWFQIDLFYVSHSLPRAKLNEANKCSLQVLMIGYGYLLLLAAQWISSGSELLLQVA